MSSCNYYPSGMELWASQYEHHLSTGGTLKCDGCRGGFWSNNSDDAAYVCKVCKKGFCDGCGSSHYCSDPNACSPENCTYHPSGLKLWGSQFEHHLSTGGTLKCDVCRLGFWSNSEDAPAYECKICKQGLCEECAARHS